MSDLLWVRKAAGTYETVCGRFVIQKRESWQLYSEAARRSPWILAATGGVEPCDGRTPWSRHFCTLDSAKRNAQRVVDAGRIIGGSPGPIWQGKPLIEVLDNPNV